MPFDLARHADPALLTQDAPAGTPARGIGAGPYVASALGDLADAVTTVGALRRGGRESNPVLGNSLGRLLAIKGAGSVGYLVVLRQLAKSHPTLAKWMWYGNGIGKGAVAVHNARVAR